MVTRSSVVSASVKRQNAEEAEGYTLLRVSGRNQGLAGLVKNRGTRFARCRKTGVEPKPAPRPQPVDA